MRVVYREQDSRKRGQVPDFLKSELASGKWEPTGFDVDFPAMVKDPAVIASMGYAGRSFLEDKIGISRWYNRDTGVMVGSVEFSEECEGPPGVAHGGAVASALDDIMGTMVWRLMGFWKAGIPTLQLSVSYRGGTPMGRQLRFDTYIAEQKGRKVTAKVVLRDPASGQVLVEAEGLFYARKPPPPPPKLSLEPSSPAHRANRAAPSASPDGLRGKVAGGRTPAPGGPLPPPPPPPSLPKLAQTLPELHVRRRPKTQPIQQAGTKSYDDALRDFGRDNPNAAANLVAFHRGDRGSDSGGSGSGGSGGGGYSGGGRDDTPVFQRSKL